MILMQELPPEYSAEHPEPYLKSYYSSRDLTLFVGEKAMRFSFGVIVFSVLCCSIAGFAQGAPQPGNSGQKAAVAVPVIVLRGNLDKGLNSKSATVGQTFVVKTAEALKLSNGTEIPVGSDITGHVLESTARANGAPESKLTLTFDTLQPKGATAALPIRGIVQAVTGPAPASVAAPAAGDMRTESVGGSASGARVPSSEVHGTPISGTGPELNERSAGVIGIKNMTLTTGPVNGVDGSKFYSADKSVKLEDNSQVMMRIALKQ